MAKSAAAIRTQMNIARRQAKRKTTKSLMAAERKMAQKVLKDSRSIKPKLRSS